MRELILHIGTHKTGTTTVQAALAASADQLLRQYGLLYPATGRPQSKFECRFGHHFLATSLSRAAGVEQPGVWTDFLEECERSSAERVLVSAEYFSSLKPDQIARLNQLVSGFERVSVILYLRNPVRFLLSAYRQQTNGHRAIACNFEQFVIENVARCDYENLVCNWAGIFGPNSLKVRVFDYVVSSDDLLADFARSTGLPAIPNMDGLHLNASSSLGVTRIISVLNNLQKWFPHRPLHTLKRVILQSRLNQLELLDQLIGTSITSRSVQLIHETFQMEKAAELRRFLIPEEMNCLRVHD